MINKLKIRFVLLFLAFAFFTTSFTTENKDFKIYDCFTFFNEIEVLNVRLHELNDKVDKFVIVESPYTFNGKKKTLYFEKNKEKFNKFLDKIIYVKFIPKNLHLTKEEFEKEQRNFIVNGLKEAKDDDIILISDVDEIFSSKKLNQFVEILNSNQSNIVKGEMRSFKFFINRWDPNRPFVDDLIAVKYLYLKKSTPQIIKEDKYNKTPIVRNSGWHFSSMGWLDKVLEKAKAFDKAPIISFSRINARNLIKEARDLIYCSVDDEYPQYITNNIDYFNKINFIDDENLSCTRFVRLLNKRQKENKSKKFLKK